MLQRRAGRYIASPPRTEHRIVMVTPCLYGSFVFDGGSGPRYCKFCVTAVAAHVYASFEGFACLVSDLLSLPTTHWAFTMWLARGHLPLALLALGLSGSKCVVIGELQPQRDNLLGFTTSAGFNHEPLAPNYARSSIVAIVGMLAVGKFSWQLR